MTAQPTARYAPSPTGSLHLGNLRTALASYLSARAQGRRFLLRIEDLDRDRCKVEFEAQQLKDLEQLGLTWDAPPVRQSERNPVYEQQLKSLIENKYAYPCFCSRKDIALALEAPHGPSGNAYPGTCRDLLKQESETRLFQNQRHSWRLSIQQAPTSFHDQFHGTVKLDLKTKTGDFVIKRGDGYYAYQLACAVDDALSGVTEVLRGNDLLDSGACQAWLLQCLNLPVPEYIHIPLMMGPGGERLAKRIGSEDLSGFLSRGYSIDNIRSYLAWTLGIGEKGKRLTLDEMISRWDIKNLPRENVIFREEDLRFEV
jgi:glutamyl-tRNA synthetase